MKRLPILVVESRPLYRRGTDPQRSGCSACVMFQGLLCKEGVHLPNVTDMPCLSGPSKPWGAHYAWSQHKISVSRNKREGKYRAGFKFGTPLVRYGPEHYAMTHPDGGTRG